MVNKFYNIKNELEQREYDTLAPYATKSRETLGRPNPRCEAYSFRTEFQCDRDKIIHSKAFRRLKHKTQVFLSPYNDHFRTRLTHTLEVAQIARTMARALRLNEDLAEAISLGHDLGHTPFGHCGERVLNELLPHGFQHNVQSVRVVEVLENMNLCRETVDGILTHSWGYEPKTPEAKIVQYADKLAYINHDIEDAVRAGVISEDDLPRDCREYFPVGQSNRLEKMIADVIKNSLDKPTVSMTEQGWFYVNKLRDWMFEHVYTDPVAKAEEPKASHIVKSLYEYYTEKLANRFDAPQVMQMVTDYISGMTDVYAIRKYTELFVPHSQTSVSDSDDLLNKLS
ncbi:MAG: deoxyguanosinetriphosphate triphosphohydrolase [Alphaproteobacteria bacterium]|nr:deoxyguanosinetriphosphate triphosphohydrolase [Alphaproteobacteria bacterium]